MNNAGSAVYSNNPQYTNQTNGTVISELVEWLKNIDMNANGTARLNIASIGDNNGGRVKI